MERYINEVIKKASKRLYFLVQLKRARVMTWCCSMLHALYVNN